MRPKYDTVFITHLPAFYKMNLYAELAKKEKVMVVVLGSGSVIRSQDFSTKITNLTVKILHQGPFEKRHSIYCLFKLWRLLKSIYYKKIVVGGWETPEFWFAILYSPKSKNALALESSIYESGIHGIAAFFKKLFLSRISCAYASGAPHEKLLKALHYKKEIRITKGVGLTFLSQKSTIKPWHAKCVFIGRLAPEKNIEVLIEVFRRLKNYHLTIIGQGPFLIPAMDNVEWIPKVAHHELAGVFNTHNVLLLPSKKEPWGLVVEEALLHGLPVIVSDRVGCKVDIVEAYQAGIVCEHDNPVSFIAALEKMSDPEFYKNIQQKISTIPFSALRQHQIEQYMTI